jgi:hypothetical protein
LDGGSEEDEEDKAENGQNDAAVGKGNDLFSGSSSSDNGD